MSEGFVHSVKVPRFYKVTAKTVQSVQEEGASIKQLIYEKKHPNLRGTYGLALTTIQHGPQLDQLLRKTKLLLNESRLDPWLARVLIAELLWGKKSLASEAKPIKTVLSYEKILLEEAKNLDNTDDDVAVSAKKVQKPRYVRVNTLVTSVDETIRSFTDDGWTLLPKCRNYSAYLKALGKIGEFTFIQDYHIPELLAFPPRTLFHDHPGYKSGAIVLQDKASCLPAYLLNAVPGSTVLDMCSAPGMKTTHLAAIMKNTGKIIAVERDTRRYKTLCEMVKTNHADCVTTINLDAMKLDPAQCADVEYILVDPSCSGSGMLDRLSLGHEASKCAPGRLISLQSFQVLLLRHALLNFPKAKRIVYSTCSMYPEENEMVVDEILENVGEAYNLVPVTKLIGFDWKNFSSKDYKCEDKCLYAKPDVDLSNGFFVAVFERNFDVPLPEYQRKEAPQKRKNDDEENQAGQKKRRRRSKANRGTENGTPANGAVIKTEDVAEETTDQDEQKKSKKQKRKEIKTENLDTEEQTEAQSAINEEDPSAEKKKKKKKKKSDDDAANSEEINGNSEPMAAEEEKSKKKKKKKHSESEILEVIPKIEISDEQKSKKKKKKHSDLEVPEVVPKIEISDEKKDKKKKKKKKDNGES